MNLLRFYLFLPSNFVLSSSNLSLYSTTIFLNLVATSFPELLNRTEIKTIKSKTIFIFLTSITFSSTVSLSLHANI